MGEVSLPPSDDGEEMAALFLPPPETDLDDLNNLFASALPSPAMTAPLASDSGSCIQHPRQDLPPSKGGGKKKQGQGQGKKNKQGAMKRPASAAGADETPKIAANKKGKPSKSEQKTHEMKKSSLELVKKVMEDLGM